MAEIKAYLPAFKNLATTYTAIDGDKALVGSTGSVCDPSATPKCTTNTDPAAIFDSGKSFATLWNEAVNSKNNSYGSPPYQGQRRLVRLFILSQPSCLRHRDETRGQDVSDAEMVRGASMRNTRSPAAHSMTMPAA